MAFLSFVLIYSFTQLTIFHYRKKIGFVPLFAFVSITIGFFNNFHLGEIVLDVGDGYMIVFFNTTLVVGVISTRFLLFLLEEPIHIRHFSTKFN